jgi:hypothetical protein
VDSKAEWIENVVDRLLRTKKINFEASLKQIEDRNKQISSECTFKPRINKDITNLNMSQDRSFGNLNSSFYQRQIDFLSNKKEKIQDLANEIAPKGVPTINPLSKVLAQTREETYLENDLNSKLYKIPIQKKEETLRLIAKREQEKFTFKPEINEISRFIAKSKTFQELSQINPIKRLKEIETKKKNEENELKECSFRPKINQNYEKIAPLFVPEEIDSTLKMIKHNKEFKEQIIKKEKEFEELKECTFRPHMVSKSLNHKKLNEGRTIQSVKGIGNYLENVKRASKMKADQLEREKYILNHSSKYETPSLRKTTVPIPFKLSGLISDNGVCANKNKVDMSNFE